MPYKILVVEDDPTIQRELVTLLQAEGYEAAAVVDFSTTLSQVNTVQPHLILLDIKLPRPKRVLPVLPDPRFLHGSHHLCHQL